MNNERNHRLFYGSSYDRGLDIVLKLWPQVLAAYPDAELHVCYGWNLFDAGYSNNPERVAWKARINEQMKQKGIVHHGRVSQAELKNIRTFCGIWVYPTYFTEINCITALECQADGCVPCVMNYGALQETVQSGVKVGKGEEGEIYDEETQELFTANLLSLMGDTPRWLEEQAKGIEFARTRSWDHVASQWKEHF